MQNPEDFLELVRGDIAAWRRVHRRGPLPLELRRRVGIVAQFLGEQAVAEELGLAPVLISRWAEQHTGARDVASGNDARHQFVDMGRPLASVLGGSAAARVAGVWWIEVSRPCGTTIRVQRPIDVALLEAVVRGATAAS